jgi:hypothetical protein
VKGVFAPLKTPPKVRDFYAFDVEGGGGLAGFVCGAVIGSSTREFYTERSAMWESLLDKGSTGAWLFSHNLEYDLPLVAGEGLWHGEIVFKDSGILWAIFPTEDRPARFCDSLGLFPRWSVDALGESVGEAKRTLPGELLGRLGRGENLGTYTQAEQDQIKERCLTDASIVYQAIARFQEELLSLGGSLQPTLAGVAMDLYRRRFQKRPWRVVSPPANKLARGAFYGGRVENFAVGQVEGVNLYDVNSLYPFVQATSKFPHPDHLRLLEGRACMGALDRWEGVAEATVAVPDTLVPPLPSRFSGKLFFPVGVLHAVWTLAELRAARDRGCDIRSTDWCLGSDSLFEPFDSFVEALWGLRKSYMATDPFRATLVKLILNSLYGRFGLNPDKGLNRLILCDRNTDWSKLEGYSTAFCQGEVVAYGPVPQTRQPSYVNTLFAGQVSSQARLCLLSALEGQGEDLIYCDTDSVMTRGALPVSDELGGWKQQMADGSADLLGPKEYVLHNHAFDARYVVKGVPSEQAQQYITQGIARFHRAVQIREALARGLQPSEWVEVIKEHRPTLPKRLPALTPFDQLSPWCLTVPWGAEELAEAASHPADWTYPFRRDRSEERQPEWVRALAAQLRVPVEQLRMSPA